MKTYEQVATEVFERRDKYFAKQKRKRKMLMISVVPVLAILLIVSAAIGLNRDTKPPVQPTSTAGQTDAATKAEEKERKTVVTFNKDLTSCYWSPEPGECIFLQAVTEAMEYYKHSDDVEYVLAFDLFSKKNEVTTDELEKEYNRLTEKGYKLYRCRTWEYQGENAEKVYSEIVVGVFTEKELNDFDVNPEYGYAFYFVRNGDGSPLRFDESTATPWSYRN